jgi:hypothetical protein
VVPRAHLILDLELDVEPIRGRIAREGGPGRTFAGWLELSSAIEALLVEALPTERPTDDLSSRHVPPFDPVTPVPMHHGEDKLKAEFDVI